MLDDQNVLQQRDPSGVLDVAGGLAESALWQPELVRTDHDNRELKHIVIAGMGGSALAADILVSLLRDWFGLPLLVVKGYQLPGFANEHTLVITSSQSGNTEETLACYDEARERNCQLVALATGGKLLERAERDGIMSAIIPAGGQPRMATIKHLKALLAIFQQFSLIDDTLMRDIETSHEWLEGEVSRWRKEVPVHENAAKQLALQSAGKTPVIYGGHLTAPLAFKWKISWNENAKNTAFHNQYPEFNHNEFIGWSSHPVEKPFVIFDLVSSYEQPRIRERMELSDRLLSGLRPKAHTIELPGETLVAQMLWACVFADMVSCYVAILNQVDPEPVVLVEKLKKELR